MSASASLADNAPQTEDLDTQHSAAGSGSDGQHQEKDRLSSLQGGPGHSQPGKQERFEHHGQEYSQQGGQEHSQQAGQGNSEHRGHEHSRQHSANDDIQQTSSASDQTGHQTGHATPSQLDAAGVRSRTDDQDTHAADEVHVRQQGQEHDDLHHPQELYAGASGTLPGNAELCML